MTTIAIQITQAGIGWAVMATPGEYFDEPDKNEVRAAFWPWRGNLSAKRGRLPLPMEERVLVYQQVLDLLAAADAEEVLLAVEEGVDRIRLGCTWVALDHSDAFVREVEVHPDGADGIMRGEIEEVLANSPRPPGV